MYPNEETREMLEKAHTRLSGQLVESRAEMEIAIEDFIKTYGEDVKILHQIEEGKILQDVFEYINQRFGVHYPVTTTAEFLIGMTAIFAKSVNLSDKFLKGPLAHMKKFMVLVGALSQVFDKIERGAGHGGS